MKKWNWLGLLWIIPLLIFAILIYLGANAHTLWSDEAQTAVFARSVNQYGVPKGFDGVNLFGYQGTALLNNDLIDHDTSWLEYYLTALSFRLFGESSFTARLSFMLFSLGSIPLIYYLTLKLSKNRFTAFLATLLAALSVQFILYSFQARYYSLAVFFGLLFVYSTLSLEKGRFKNKLLFIISAVGYLYSHYLFFVILYLSLFLTLAILNTKILKQYLMLGFVSFSFFAPWYIVMHPFDNKAGFVSGSLTEVLMRFSAYITHALLRYNQANVFPVVLLFILIWIIFKNRKKVAEIWGIIFLSLLIFIYYFLIITVSTFVNFSLATLTDGRYHVPILVLMLILSAMVFERIWVWKKGVFVVLLVIFLFTNLLTLGTPRSLILEYLNEVQNPYPSPDFEVAKYLKDYAKDNQTIFLNLDRDHEPLIFFLGKKLKFINRISPADDILTKDNPIHIPTYIYNFAGEPNWVVLYSKRIIRDDDLTYDLRDRFPRGLYPGVDLKNDYTETVLPVYFSDVSRPEIGDRSFVRVKPDPNDQIFIYRKKKH